MGLLNSNSLNQWFTQTLPQNARNLWGEIKRAPSDLRGLISPEMNQQMRQSINKPNPIDKDAAMAMAMDYLQTTNPVAGIGGMFIGKGAKTWDVLKAQEAEEMLAKGIDPREVWKKTGTARFVDGQLRQEIPDNLAKARDYHRTPKNAFSEARTTAFIDGNDPAAIARIKAMTPYAAMTKNQLTQEYSRTGQEIIDAATSGNMDLAKQLMENRSGLDALLSEMGNRKAGPMSAYLKHGELGKAYPDVYKMPTRIDYDIDSLGAYNRPTQYRREHIELKEKPNWSAAKSTALHEIQHPIQAREGWARGGSPNDFLNGGVINPQTGQQYTIEEAYDAYRKLPGEAEARLTQKRMNLDASQRLEHYPYDMGEYGLDIPIDQLIVRGLLK